MPERISIKHSIWDQFSIFIQINKQTTNLDLSYEEVQSGGFRGF